MVSQETTVEGGAPRDIPHTTRMQEEQLPVSTPVEMTSMASSREDFTDAVQDNTPTDDVAAVTSNESAQMPPGPMRMDTTTALSQSVNPPPPPMPAALAVAPHELGRTISTAIGPSTDLPVPPSKDDDEASSGPSLTITLLLTSGARHPFKLDAKYLSKRNVDVPKMDPFNMSVYKLKELILREWRDEWEAKPSSPSYIRLISFGKLLDDKTALKGILPTWSDLRRKDDLLTELQTESKFNHDAPNVVHMTIKPQDYIEEEDAKGAKAGYTSSRDGTETRSPGCRCIVM